MSTIPTPPETTLSDNSDTELDTANMASTKALYLIVATALKPSMGIGLKGELPWPALKKDMSFFRHITSDVSKTKYVHERLGRRNAVIMGRKTWESIPLRFRPLKGRINVVVTRRPDDFTEADGKEILAVGGLHSGLDVLEGWGEQVGKVFVIGGSQIYGAAVELQGREVRVLQTQVRKTDGEEIECDTFFPLQLGENVDGWRKASKEEITGWVDSKMVPGADRWEADGEGLEIRVMGWERIA